jgi:hypothetical protein
MTCRQLSAIAAMCTVFGLLLAGCGSKSQKPKVDPVTQAMKQTVNGSMAQVMVVGRTDWDVDPDHNQYWVNVTLQNMGATGQVALRAAIQTATPYFGIGESPTEPMYFQMGAGQTVTQRLTGKLSAKKADKALGVNVEVYPKAAGQPKSNSPLSDLPGIGGNAPTSLDQLPKGEGE